MTEEVKGDIPMADQTEARFVKVKLQSGSVIELNVDPHVS